MTKASTLCLFLLGLTALAVVAPSTARMTTQSHPTAASAKTTHSKATTAPKTTHSHTTTFLKTTADHTTGKTTESPAHTTSAAGNTTVLVNTTTVVGDTTEPPAPTTTATGNTTEPLTYTMTESGNTTFNATVSTVSDSTTATYTTVPEPEEIIASYQFKNGSEICMLFVFNAMLKVKYNTTNNKVQEATLPIGGNINVTGNGNWTTFSYCKDVVPRVFGIRAQYPVPNSKTMGTVALDFQIGIYGQPPYRLMTLVTGDWTYTEPFFPKDSVKYGEREFGAVQMEMGTMGKTFRCQTLMMTSGPLTIILAHMMMQPFADLANGTFGDAIEECNTNPTTMGSTTIFTNRPTKPSPSNGGMIAGIVIGVLAFVALTVGAAVFVVRKRRMKGAAYGNLQEDHGDYKSCST